MVFARLVQFIEEHYEPISNRILDRIRGDGKLSHLQRISQGDLEEMGQRLVKNLSHWLLEAQRGEVERRYEDIGKQRFREGVPLHELVWGLLLVRRCVVDYVREQGLAQCTVDIYAEEELEHRMDELFDELCFHLVRGYEVELRKATHLAAAV